MRRLSAWDELGRCGAFQLEWDDEAREFPRLPRRNHLGKKMKLISSINGKSLTGRSQRITSSSNPSRKHAPRAVSCQLIRLEIARNSSTYLSNLRPLCRNPHSASSAEVILWVQYSVTVVQGCQERGDDELHSNTLMSHRTEIAGDRYTLRE